MYDSGKLLLVKVYTLKSTKTIVSLNSKPGIARKTPDESRTYIFFNLLDILDPLLHFLELIDALLDAISKPTSL